jgi:hypothetical protein
VELTFTEAAYEHGKLLTLIALGVTALLIVLGLFTERRQIV